MAAHAVARTAVYHRRRGDQPARPPRSDRRRVRLRHRCRRDAARGRVDQRRCRRPAAARPGRAQPRNRRRGARRRFAASRRLGDQRRRRAQAGPLGAIRRPVPDHAAPAVDGQRARRRQRCRDDRGRSHRGRRRSGNRPHPDQRGLLAFRQRRLDGPRPRRARRSLPRQRAPRHNSAGIVAGGWLCERSNGRLDCRDLAHRLRKPAGFPRRPPDSPEQLDHPTGDGDRSVPASRRLGSLVVGPRRRPAGACHFAAIRRAANARRHEL